MRRFRFQIIIRTCSQPPGIINRVSDFFRCNKLKKNIGNAIQSLLNMNMEKQHCNLVDYEDFASVRDCVRFGD